MGGVFKAIGSIFSSSLFQFIAPFIPVVGPFLALASRIWSTIKNLQSGNLLGAGLSLFGGGGLGGALGSVFKGVLSNVGGWLGQSGLSFATAAAGAMGGPVKDILQVASLAKQVANQVEHPDIGKLVLSNAASWAQYAQSRAYI